MKQKYKRLKSILLLLFCLSFGLWLILKNFNDNIVFFYSPTELKQKPVINQLIRVGGLVIKGSVIKHGLSKTEFSITDNQTSLKIHFEGALPNLFRDNQGIVAKGKLVDEVFEADELLAKHDENYMPKEVANSLKNGSCPTCK
jgi:cytochrome c-type biogenesis protein CcmE